MMDGVYDVGKRARISKLEANLLLGVVKGIRNLVAEDGPEY